MTHPFIEAMTSGAIFTFAPLVLLLAVDLVCWSRPMLRKHVRAGLLLRQNLPVERGLSRE
jgi:hypothetical protein